MWHHRRTCIRYGASPSRQLVPTPLIRQRRLRQRMGVDLPTVQRVSGHKTFEMVFRYSSFGSAPVLEQVAGGTELKGA
jgi:hypothetical protein